MSRFGAHLDVSTSFEDKITPVSLDEARRASAGVIPVDAVHSDGVFFACEMDLCRRPDRERVIRQEGTHTVGDENVST